MAKRIPDDQIIPTIDKAIQDYRGNVSELEAAIGVWIVGRQFGWKVMLLMHDRKTLAKYEDILGVDFRTQLDDVGSLAHKSIAWKAMETVSNFWKAVRGEIPNVKSLQLR